MPQLTTEAMKLDTMETGSAVLPMETGLLSPHGDRPAVVPMVTGLL